jgi:hypothetical protein
VQKYECVRLKVALETGPTQKNERQSTATGVAGRPSEGLINGKNGRRIERSDWLAEAETLLTGGWGGD